MYQYILWRRGGLTNPKICARMASTNNKWTMCIQKTYNIVDLTRRLVPLTCIIMILAPQTAAFFNFSHAHHTHDLHLFDSGHGQYGDHHAPLHSKTLHPPPKEHEEHEHHEHDHTEIEEEPYEKDVEMYPLNLYQIFQNQEYVNRIYTRRIKMS